MSTNEYTMSDSVSLGDATISNNYTIHYVKNSDVVGFDATGMKFNLSAGGKFQSLTLDDDAARDKAKLVLDGLRKHYPGREVTLSNAKIGTKCPYVKRPRCVKFCSSDACVTHVIDIACLSERADIKSKVSTKHFFPWTDGPSGVKKIVYGTLKPTSVSISKEDLKDKDGALNCTVKFTPVQVRYQTCDPDADQWDDDEDEDEVSGLLDRVDVERKRKAVDDSLAVLDAVQGKKNKVVDEGSE